MTGTSVHFYVFLLILLLIFFNAFFVAAEFSMVRIRSSKVEQILYEKKRFSKYLKKVTDNLNMHLAATQIGITLVTLGLGALAKPSVSSALRLFFYHFFSISSSWNAPLSFGLAFFLLTYFQIVFGEQLPKIISIEKTETIALLISPILFFFCKFIYFPIRWISFSTETALKLLRIPYVELKKESHSEDEIMFIVANSQELEPEEQKMIHNVFTFNDRMVREIMTHRKDMECLYIHDSLEENLLILKENKYSRYPVCGKDKDDILGYIFIQDFEDLENVTDFTPYIREVPLVFETTSLPKALKSIRDKKSHLALVTDEYGGISGLITIEDILEEIVGEINDELDEETITFFPTENGLLVNGSLLIDEVERELGMTLEEIDGIDTIGGYVLNQLDGEIVIGKSVTLPEYSIFIHSLRENSIEFLRFEKKKTVVEEETFAN